MNAPLPQSLRRQLGAMTQPEAAEALDRLEGDFDASVESRASLIERAAIAEDITEALPGLTQPEDVTVIASAFRCGAADAALGPVLVRILRREWRDMAEHECLRVAEAALDGKFSVSDITAKDLKRAAVIRDMGVRHG